MEIQIHVPNYVRCLREVFSSACFTWLIILSKHNQAGSCTERETSGPKTSAGARGLFCAIYGFGQARVVICATKHYIQFNNVIGTEIANV